MMVLSCIEIVLVPVDLRCKVLEHLHVGHNGINVMKSETRNWV